MFNPDYMLVSCKVAIRLQVEWCRVEWRIKLHIPNSHAKVNTKIIHCERSDY